MPLGCANRFNQVLFLNQASNYDNDSVDYNEKDKATLSIDGPAFTKRIIIACISVELILVIFDLGLNYSSLIDSSSIRKIFNLAHEQSLGTWFSVLQMAAVGLTLLTLFAVHYHQSGFHSAKGWGILSSFYLYLSADDAAKIHERVGSSVARALEEPETLSTLGSWQSHFPSYSWQWVFAPIFAVMGLYIALFLWKKLTTWKLKFILFSAFSCWALAIGIDFLEGQERLFEYLASQWDVKPYTVSHPFLVAEEFLEMFGATLFLFVYLNCLTESLSKYKEIIFHRS